MILIQATSIAERIRAALAPSCERIEIAGSIRRRVPEVHDIELVAIPHTSTVYDLLGMPDRSVRSDGFVQSIHDIGSIVKGDLSHGKYIQLRAPEGIFVDLFLACPENWGLILAIRTGNARYSHHVLAAGWCRAGYHSEDGMLMKGFEKIPIFEERDLFDLIGVPWAEPWERNL